MRMYVRACVRACVFICVCVEEFFFRFVLVCVHLKRGSGLYGIRRVRMCVCLMLVIYHLAFRERKLGKD